MADDTNNPTAAELVHNFLKTTITADCGYQNENEDGTLDEWQADHVCHRHRADGTLETILTINGRLILISVKDIPA